LKNIQPPLISIVIPTFNHGDFLERAIKSILNQTFEDWEAIIIDNHSTDKTDEILVSFNDPRIKYKKIHNKGVIAVSRNAAIKIARGEWIAFLDSDDWWVPEKLKMCLNYIHKGADVIYHDLEIKSHKSKFFQRKKIKSRQLKKPILKDLLIRGNAINNSSVIVRKSLFSLIGGISEDQSLIATEDYNTWLKIANISNRFFYLPKILGYYYVHNYSISKKNMSIPLENAVKEFINILNEKEKKLLESNLRYASGRYQYLNDNQLKAKEDLLFVLFNGSFELKLKSLYMFIMISFK
jgi:glycosyltransferase involved in cell wall biosynthesis